MYHKHVNGFSRAPGNRKSCWSVGDTKISFLNTLVENGPYILHFFPIAALINDIQKVHIHNNDDDDDDDCDLCSA